MARRILITGATGGLGLGLVGAACAAGLDVLATGRSDAARGRILSAGAEFVQADLTDPDAPAALCEGRESVIHAAALSASWGPREAFERVNVDATRDLIGAARSAGCSRFVYISSPSIYAAFRDRIRIRSADPPTRPPLSIYARTKLAAEELVLAADAPAFATCAVRPRAIVGPDDKVLLPALLALARRPRMPLPNGGRALIELTDVRDAAAAILGAEERIAAVAGRGINISGGRPVSVRAVALALAEDLGTRPNLIDLPLPIARSIAAISEAWAKPRRSEREPLLTRYALATLGYSQTFDLSDAERLIGYKPRHDGFATLRAEARKYAR